MISLLLIVCLSGVLAQRIDSPPSIVACLPTRLTFGGGVPPYYISVVPAGQPAAEPIAVLPPQTGTSYSWPADVAPGSDVTFVIRDSEGVINYSSPIPVQDGPVEACSLSTSSTSTSSSYALSTLSSMSTISSPPSIASSMSQSRSPSQSSSGSSASSSTSASNSSSTRTPTSMSSTWQV
ncbi:hypothetical protein OIV83_005085 [Microbotryomycetes sp. JL201]|nr:hypothetical protein OIV83_005085 [Microbotryomycetes sp. JL201]